MRYISFDIECCDGKHICEFGYVLTDENFKILKKECFTINPDKPFNLVGRKKRADCILFFSEDTYYKSPQFPAFYNTIKNLLSTSDAIIFGHAIKSDVIFLREACKRYKLPPINFQFVDSQLLYMEFSGEKSSISLEKAESILNLAPPCFHHKSDEDASLTIELVENICKKLNVTVHELITLCPIACGNSRNFNIQFSGNDLSSMLNALETNPNVLSQKAKKACIYKFSKSVQPQGQIRESCLNGKQICFSTLFEKNHAKETIKLIQILANYGCNYNMKVSENDYYVACESELTNTESGKNTRCLIALKNDGGRNIKVLSFAVFLKIIGLTIGELENIKMPTVQKREIEKVYSTETISNTIGDQLRAKGIDITKIFTEC